MKQLYIFIFLCISAASLSAQVKKFDKLLDYTGVTVLKIEKDGIRIIHSNGVATIPIERIPEEIRQDLGMSLDGIKDFREKKAADRALAMRKAKIKSKNKKLLDEAHVRVVTGRVSQVVTGGILLKLVSTTDGTYEQVPQYETRTQTRGTALSGRKTYTRRVITGYKKHLNLEFHDGRLVFVKCDNESLTDGDIFKGDMWLNGRFSYESVGAGVKTIPQYTTNPKDLTGQ